jgi:hypothetical protein
LVVPPKNRKNEKMKGLIWNYRGIKKVSPPFSEILF